MGWSQGLNLAQTRSTVSTQQGEAGTAGVSQHPCLQMECDLGRDLSCCCTWSSPLTALPAAGKQGDQSQSCCSRLGDVTRKMMFVFAIK